MKSKGNGAVLINQIDTQQGDVGSLSRDNVMTVADCFHKILGTLKNNEDAMVQGGARADAENELKSEPKKVESVDMANKVEQYALMQIDNVSGSETRGEELVKACGGRWKHKARLVKPIGENTASGSDHYPILGELLTDAPIVEAKKKRRFHFEQMWTLEKGCEDIIREAWDSTDAMGGVKEGIKNCVGKLAKWNKLTFGHVQK
ncbi:hypothetical protein GBA52_024885 [Prunus armeniaca]|nr:hypothetical protein GBA52_024885 [Prunus armeniaca]